MLNALDVQNDSLEKGKKKNQLTFRTSRVLSFLPAIFPIIPRMLSSLTLAASHDVSAVILHSVVTCSVVMHCERYENNIVDQL